MGGLVNKGKHLKWKKKKIWEEETGEGIDEIPLAVN